METASENVVDNDAREERHRRRVKKQFSVDLCSFIYEADAPLPPTSHSPKPILRKPGNSSPSSVVGGGEEMSDKGAQSGASSSVMTSNASVEMSSLANNTKLTSAGLQGGGSGDKVSVDTSSASAAAAAAVATPPTIMSVSGIVSSVVTVTQSSKAIYTSGSNVRSSSASGKYFSITTCNKWVCSCIRNAFKK